MRGGLRQPAEARLQIVESMFDLAERILAFGAPACFDMFHLRSCRDLRLRRAGHCVYPAAVRADADAEDHVEAPLVALPGLAHFGIARVCAVPH